MNVGTNLMEIMMIKQSIAECKQNDVKDDEMASVYDFLDILVDFYKQGYTDALSGELSLKKKITEENDKTAQLMGKIGKTAVLFFIKEMISNDRETYDFLKNKFPNEQSA